MFIAIPLETKPSWRSPPWMTLLLIAINCWVFFAWQVPEERAVQRAAERYQHTPLPKIELPLYAQELDRRAAASGKARDRRRADAVEQAQRADMVELVYQAMWHDSAFRERLLDGRLIGPGDPRHADWKAARDAFTPTEPARFTERWSQNHDANAPFRPITWLTNTFLHGGVGHLVGNMVFLFLFGFTLEMALGRGLYLACYLLGGIGASALAAWVYAGNGGLGLGASGAVSALMGMYVVLYRLRRIPFFYMLFFYFNYARWPALVMLPVWMAFELVQHLMGGAQVAYMAHLGGLITGALLMALIMATRRVEAPSAPAPSQADAAAAARHAELKPLVDKARALTQSLRFADAALVWQRAARLAPTDPELLRAWFDAARHDPASDSFHAAARQIFKLSTRHAPHRRLQVESYRVYLDRAKPGIRISPATLQQLVRSFVLEGEIHDAEQLARVLARSAPPPEGWLDTFELLINAQMKAGRHQQAQTWLPLLERHAPHEALTRRLAGQGAS
ncbi:rhomboid family intramembrane serine protease [Ottowia sp. GY511]|uniref:Rhomboid family intramembrane serine protease n=1 Tax=Ottowia flava TaxID=2675430 RepID=A0ABW4KW64_9BURK|nr:rhomboid family intramembrane serine protease [Ottowia sp. GY511]TXK24944.1 rhomboid family intramembrane serine protease [Ottowia sp. GY511]